MSGGQQLGDDQRSSRAALKKNAMCAYLTWQRRSRSVQRLVSTRDDLTESTAEINRDSVFFHKLFVVARYTTVSYGDSVGIGLLMRTISAEEAAVPLLFFPTHNPHNMEHNSQVTEPEKGK